MPCKACPASLMDDCAREGCALRLVAPSAFDGVEAQLTRLDVERGDVLVLRTRNKLQPATAEKWQDQLVALCRSQGVQDVSVIVLDDCTDLTIERPDTRLVQQRRDVPQPMGC